MRANLSATFAFVALCLPACGPMLNLRDGVVEIVDGPRYGGMTPYGKIKRDLWGDTYVEPYAGEKLLTLKELKEMEEAARVALSEEPSTRQ